MEPNRSTDNTTFHAFFLRRLIVIWLFMEIQIKAYAYTIDIITEIRYFCKCNNAVFGKFRIIFTYAISKTDSSLHRSSHALFKISGNGKFVRTAILPPHLPAISAKAHRTILSKTALSHENRHHPCLLMNALYVSHLHYPLLCAITLASHVKGEVLSPEKFRATTGGIAIPTLAIPTTL